MKYLVVLLLSAAVLIGADLVNPGGVYIPGRASLAVMDSFTPSLSGASNYVVGLGYDGNGGEFWVSDNQNKGGLGMNLIHVFAGVSPYTLQATFNQNSTSGWGILDMAYCSGIMYVTDMNNNVVNYYNTTTQAKIGSFNANSTGSYALATDGANTFYTGDFNTAGNVYSALWDGVSGSSPSWSVFTTSPIPETGILGAAYDDSWPCLWVTISSSTGTIYQIAMDGSQIAVYDQTAQGTGPAGADMAPLATDDGYLWVVMQAEPDVVYCYDTDVSLDNATWGTIKTMF